MAKKDNGQKFRGYTTLQDGFHELAGKIKKGELSGAVLLCGKEQYLVQWAVNEIIKLNINEATAALDLVRFDANTASHAAVIEACETLPLFSPKKVVILEDFYPAEGRERRKRERSETEMVAKENSDWSLLFDYLEKIDENVILAAACEIPDVTSKAFKAFSDRGEVFALKTLGGADLRSFINKSIGKTGHTASPAVINRIIELSGYEDRDSDYTLFNLENDINKIVAHAAGGKITEEDVSAGIAGNVDRNIFEFLDAASQGRKDVAYRLFFNRMQTESSVMPLLSQIISQFERILFVREMRDESRNMDEICKALGQKPGSYPVKKAWGFSEYYTIERLKNILKGAYDVDRRVKSGMLEESLAMEMFISQL